MRPIAALVGAMFSDDGQRFRTASDRSLKDVAKSHGARVHHPNGRGTTPIVYNFTDGSAIVEYVEAWDYRADGCTEYCWAGVGCDCADRAAESRRYRAIGHPQVGWDDDACR